MKLKDIKLDFHRNGWVVQKLPENQLRRKIIENLEPGRKDIGFIADNLYAFGENRAICLLDYYPFNPKYASIVSLKSLRDAQASGYELHDDNLNSCIGLTRDNGKSWFYVLPGIEVMADAGHFIAAGIRPENMKFMRKECYYPNGPKLQDKLAEAQQLGAIIIPAHPMPEFGIVKKAVLRALKEPSANLGLNEEDLRKYARFFDAIETRSLSMTERQSRRVALVAEEIGKPKVTNSDLPIESGMASYNLFPELDFSDITESIRKSLRGNEHSTHAMPSAMSALEKARHILINILVKRENF